ncbi:hypothetical protein JTE90_026967, partial [Oedothorax gibbosus]
TTLPPCRLKRRRLLPLDSQVRHWDRDRWRTPDAGHRFLGGLHCPTQAQEEGNFDQRIFHLFRGLTPTTLTVEIKSVTTIAGPFL